MSTSIQPLSTSEQDAIAYLRSAQAIRWRCEQLFTLACTDQLQHFRCDLSQIDTVADYVIQVTRRQYPDLQIPFHSRWRHFEVGNGSRLTQLNRRFAELSPLEIARAKFDLVIPSVLLDAGAGSSWHYQEASTGQVLQRSEGLAVASFDLFCQGGFSSDPKNRFQTDAVGLQAVTAASLSKAFQVSANNPLVGIEGRVALLQRFGQVLGDRPHWFGSGQPRPGYLVDYLLEQTENHQLSAGHVFQAVLEGLGEIWPGRLKIGDVNLGDVWQHSALPAGMGSQLVPFHKLSQWLTYSLLEPLQDLGLEIIGLDQLTGLPEYRNGGLCLDLGLLQDKHESVRRDRHSLDSEVIIEWRSLTVILLDQIAMAVRHKLGLDAAALPLVKVLQGGTWAAGRQIAADLRAGGVSPIQINSDGTVF